MNSRGTVNVAMAASVAAAEFASVVYIMVMPGFFHPGDRLVYTTIGSAVFNLVIYLLISHLVENFWQLRKWQDVIHVSVWLTLVYVSIRAPHLVTWWNPMTYTYLLGPTAHTFVLLAAMLGSMCYFKNKK